VQWPGSIGPAGLDNFVGNLRGDTRGRGFAVGGPGHKVGARLHLGHASPTLGVLDERLAIGRLGFGSQQEALPRDVDPVTKVLGHIVETNRPDVAPRSKKVGPDQEGYRRSHGVDVTGNH
jgi:hypothetical protein